MTGEPQQAELLIDPPEQCRRCGRDWPGILSGPFVDLAALMKLPPDERVRFTRCWTGNCSRVRH